MCHEFIGLFTGSVEADRMVDIVMYREGCVGIGTINRAAGGVNKMFNRVVPAAFEDIQEAAYV